MNMSLADASHIDHTYAGTRVNYLVIVDRDGSTERISRYLDDTGILVHIAEDVPVWIAIIPSRATDHYVARLGSGMIGASTYSTLESAVEAAIDRSWDYPPARNK